MKTLSLLFLIFFLLISCQEQKDADEIVIEGQVTNMPDGKIYLTEAHHWEISLDSTVCTNGHFVFKIHTDSSFVPYMAAIHFPDRSSRTGVGSIFFRNYMLGADSTKYLGEAFYLEKGHTRIEGNYKSKEGLRIFAGKETNVMFKNQFTDFGWLGNIDSTKRKQRIVYFKKEINHFPFSYFLLQSVYDAKEQYSEKEISDILALFNPDIQKSKLADQFRTYLANRTDPSKPYPNLFLLNATNQRQLLINPNAKISVLVFWASWCGPCRMEIPTLKDIQEEYKRKGISLVSISVDEDKANWLQALKQENMSWSQCIAEKSEIDLVKQEFNFSAIPFVVITDDKGKEVAKFTGYDKDQKKNYETVINKFID